MTFLYVGNPFFALLLLPTTLADEANTSVRGLHYVLIFVSYNEKLRMAGLDDCSILQPGHLDGKRLGGMHDSISTQNSYLTAPHARVVRPWAAWPKSTKPGVIWEKPEYPQWLGTHATQVDKGLRMSGQVSLGSIPRGHDIKKWSHLGKVLCLTNWSRFRSGSSKALNALWTRQMAPTVLSTRLGTTWWKIQIARAGWYMWLSYMMALNVWVHETMLTISHC
jgi:hypothetical protein